MSEMSCRFVGIRAGQPNAIGCGAASAPALETGAERFVDWRWVISGCHGDRHLHGGERLECSSHHAGPKRNTHGVASAVDMVRLPYSLFLRHAHRFHGYDGAMVATGCGCAYSAGPKRF